MTMSSKPATAAETTKTSTVPASKIKAYGKIVLTLENCLLPEAKLDPTASMLDGLDRETEIDLRILGCELIQTAGILLKLPQVAMATGQVLFQRFFYSKSFVRHSMETTAMSCICLASKIEEAPRRIRDVINVFHHIKQVRAQKDIVPLILDQNYISLKTQVIKAERRVLKELGFCVHVKHPHKLIVTYLQVLCFEKNQKMMQVAWNFMNDSLRTDVFVRHQPETIACACIYLTGRKLNIPLPTNPPWFDIFKVKEDDIVDVCYRIMALYKREKTNVEKLENAVDQLKKRYMESRQKGKAGAAGQNTPPSVTLIDRSNGGGTHNAWGGFISRNLPAAELNAPAPSFNKDDRSPTANRKDAKRSYSKSRSRSHTPDHQKNSHSRNFKKSRNRSRTPPMKSSNIKKKSRNYSRSRTPSLSPPSHSHKSSKHKRRSVSTDRGDKNDYYSSNGDRGSKHHSRSDKERYRRSDRKEKSSKLDNYKSSSSGHRSSKHSRDRDGRDRKKY